MGSRSFHYPISEWCIDIWLSITFSQPGNIDPHILLALTIFCHIIVNSNFEEGNNLHLTFNPNHFIKFEETSKMSILAVLSEIRSQLEYWQSQGGPRHGANTTLKQTEIELNFGHGHFCTKSFFTCETAKMLYSPIWPPVGHFECWIMECHARHTLRITSNSHINFIMIPQLVQKL